MKTLTLSRTQPPATRSCVPSSKWRTTSRRRRKIRSSVSVSKTVSLTSTLRRCCCSDDPAAMPALLEKARMEKRERVRVRAGEPTLRLKEGAGERQRRGARRRRPPPRGSRWRRRGGMRPSFSLLLAPCGLPLRRRRASRTMNIPLASGPVTGSGLINRPFGIERLSLDGPTCRSWRPITSPAKHAAAARSTSFLKNKILYTSSNYYTSLILVSQLTNQIG